jgi:hypothetical protein
LNGDGTPDIAVADSSGLSIRLGDGHGGFGLPIPGPALAGTVTALATGDFNGDGNLDLAVGLFDFNTQSGTLQILLNNGYGAWLFGASLPTGAISTLLTGDSNQDGDTELVMASSYQNFSIGDVTMFHFSDNGSGAPTDPTGTFTDGLLTTNSKPAIALGDFNGDGRLDIVVLDSTQDQVTTLLATSIPFIFSRTTSSVPAGSTAVAAGHFGRDTTLDLAVTGSSGTSILSGVGDGSFLPPGTTIIPGPSDWVSVGDFNRDGNLDLAVLSTSVGVVLGNSDGTFNAPLAFAAGEVPSSIAIADFNGDGAPDLLVDDAGATIGVTGLSVLLNQSPLTTVAVQTSSGPAVAGQLVTLTASVSTAYEPNPLSPTGVVTFMDGPKGSGTFSGVGAASSGIAGGIAGGIVGAVGGSGPSSPTVLGSATLNSSGIAVFSTSSLGIGYHNITVEYQGDPNFTASTSPVLNQLINQDASVTTLRPSANPALAGQSVALIATVSAQSPGSGTPSGIVLFEDGTTVLGSVSLSSATIPLTTPSSAVASFSAMLGAGPHSLSAVYAGDGNFTGGASAPLTQVVNNPMPVISSLSPSSLPEGSAAFTLTVNGSNLMSGASVLWNGSPLPIVSQSGTQIQVSVPATLMADEGSASVTVTNPAPGGGATLPQTFTIADAALTAHGVNLTVTGNKIFSGVVATFTDGNLAATQADFYAIIIWDNGRAFSGTITGKNGTFQVAVPAATPHTFAAFNNVHTISVQILDVGGSTATVTDNVIDPAPRITSAAGADFTVDTPGSFTVTASGSPPPALHISRLPEGLTFTPGSVPGTAILSGTPAAGTSRTTPYTLTVTAGNGPSVRQTFKLTIKPLVTALAVPAQVTVTAPPPSTYILVPGSPKEFQATFTLTEAAAGSLTGRLKVTGFVNLPEGVTFVRSAMGKFAAGRETLKLNVIFAYNSRLTRNTLAELPSLAGATVGVEEILE